MQTFKELTPTQQAEAHGKWGAGAGQYDGYCYASGIDGEILSRRLRIADQPLRSAPADHWQHVGDVVSRVLEDLTRNSLGRGLKLGLAVLLVISTMACASSPTSTPPSRQPNVQKEVQRQSERVVRNTTSQIIRAPARAIQRQINCALRGGC